jgi:hypothetical protein
VAGTRRSGIKPSARRLSQIFRFDVLEVVEVIVVELDVPHLPLP